MSQVRLPSRWIDALSGMVSPTGAECGYLADAVTKWAASQWPKSPRAAPSREDAFQQTRKLLDQIASDLRALTGHDESVIARCLTSASAEDLLQWTIVLCRRHHQAAASSSASNSSSDSGELAARCLAAVGSDHGRHVVGRMLSGSADLRDPVWPLVPGFLHAGLDSLHQRIDETVAMVMISPLEQHNMLCPVAAANLIAIRAACDEHGACLVIDHRNSPPLGSGHFWIHDSISEITADAVLMSAGLTGGESGGVLVLNQTLAAMVHAESDAETEMRPSDFVAQLVASTLRQWSDHSWQSVHVDEFATSLAERLAARECVRDLHVTGRSIGIELDLPAMEWVRVAAKFSLRVGTAGEFAIALQPPLVLGPADESELLDRIDLVFDSIEAAEQQGESHSSADSQSAASEVIDVEPATNGVEGEAEDSEAEDRETEDREAEDRETEDREAEDFEAEDFEAKRSADDEQETEADDSAAEKASDEEEERHQLEEEEEDDVDEEHDVDEDEDEDEDEDAAFERTPTE